MRRKQTDAETFWEVVPEIEQNGVRYREYIKKFPNEPKQIPVKKSPAIALHSQSTDCEIEIDDEGDKPDYTSYIIPTENPEIIEEPVTEKKVPKPKEKETLSLKLIYLTLRNMKSTIIRKIIKESKSELLEIREEIHKHPPNKSLLSVAQNLFNCMFNPEQKLSIYMYVRETLGYPPHLFKGMKSIYTVLAPEAAVIVFRKKFKINSRSKALGTLASLELNDDNFYSNLCSKDILCQS